MPDDDCTVLLRIDGGDEPVWLGYRDGAVWRYVEGPTVTHHVARWAEMPTGAGVPF
jgi:hypothetical protein